MKPRKVYNAFTGWIHNRRKVPNTEIIKKFRIQSSYSLTHENGTHLVKRLGLGIKPYMNICEQQRQMFPLVPDIVSL